MKKIMLMLAAVMFTAMVFAQDKKMTELKISQLPKSVTDFVSKNFQGGTITRAGKIEEKGVVNYVTVIENKGTKHSYIFDSEGKLIGKGDKLAQPAAKPPVKTQDAKATPKPATTDEPAPKK
jgi:hypothetical protein